MIGIIIAMESELKPYLEFPHSIEQAGSKIFYRLKIGSVPVVIVLSGIGKVNASHSATLLINIYKPEIIISTGVSGGLGVLNVMDIVVATKTCQYDVDTSALGDPIGLVSTVNKIYFETASEFSDKLLTLPNAKKGILACGDCFVANDSDAKRIVNTFDAVACDMESGAIGQICYIEQVPYVAIRCITDGAGNNAQLTYNLILEKASSLLANGVIDVIKRLD
ncbi:MAG TPA: 5'-methylthioadenosine/S-adenosylhomocysteine nucleosidase [Clostridia bacterium]|nr:5'-methylthioadenosine/S-adenosylhomocysteine nucleosidase [Clostridia bacterium]